MGTGINNLSELIALHTELVALVNMYDTPTANPKLLAKIRLMAAQMQYLDEYCYRCLRRLETAAEIYYSDRKHKKTHLGAEGYGARMTDALRCITTRIAEIKAAQGK